MNIKLTQEIINKIFDLYKEATGCLESRYPSIEDVKTAIEKYGVFEYRAGSKWSGDSKFVISYEKAYFYPNYEPRNKREKEKIERARTLFGNLITEYIESIKH